MSLEKKQKEFEDELRPIGTDFINGKMTVQEYLKKREELTKKYGFDKGLDGITYSNHF